MSKSDFKVCYLFVSCGLLFKFNLYSRMKTWRGELRHMSDAKNGVRRTRKRMTMMMTKSLSDVLLLVVCHNLGTLPWSRTSALFCRIARNIASTTPSSLYANHSSLQHGHASQSDNRSRLQALTLKRAMLLTPEPAPVRCPHAVLGGYFGFKYSLCVITHIGKASE